MLWLNRTPYVGFESSSGYGVSWISRKCVGDLVAGALKKGDDNVVELCI